MRSLFRIAPVIAALLAAAACDSPSDSGPRAADVEALSGDAQQGTAGAQLATPLVARVTDSNDRPLEGQTVLFTVLSGGGSVSAASVVTGTGGTAETLWTLGTVAGQEQRLEARVVDGGGATLAADTFTATAVAGAPARVVKVSGDAQTAAPVDFVADSLAVRVEDANGNPVTGAAVTWTVTAGGGSVSATTSTSGAGGIARTRWLLGTSGTQSVRAVAAAGGTAVTFTATLAAAPDVAYGPTFSAGPRQTCALTTAGRLYCWGRSYERQWDEPTPVAFPGTLAEVTAGNNNVCALTPAGAAYCMGVGLEGQLGNGVRNGTGSPNALVPVQGGLTFTQLASGGAHICGITSSGAAYCWGYSDRGQLGAPAPECGGFCSSLPLAVSGGHTFSRLDAEGSVTCGVTAGTGRLLCWGLGYGTTPVEVGAERVYTQVAVGFDHVCALSGTQVYCRGVNTYGQLGTGETVQQNALTPVVGGNAFAQVVAGQHYTCGLTTGGAAFCWGRNSEGVLGSGPITEAPRPTPTPVSGGLTFTALSGGLAHVCGRATDGRLYCWGNDSFGQIGDGILNGIRPQPTRVMRQL